MDICREVETLLANHAGFSADLIGRGILERAVAKLAQRAGAAIGPDLLARLESLGQEWRQLLDDLVVPETWFFRDREPFLFLASHLRRQPPLAASNILSIPCSTGEEPYSIAMTLLEAGLAPRQFTIHAADLSAAAIERARRAEYGKSSFREETDIPMGKYFTVTPQGWRLCETVKRLVQFRQANLMNPLELSPGGPFDVIFCRNVLIYMHEEARQRVLASLRAALAEDGILFTGYSEVAICLQAGFRPVEHARAFACRKRLAAAASSRPQAQAKKPPPRARRMPAPAHAPRAALTLDAARRLADQGELEAAAAACEELIREGRAEAEVYYLLGLISQVADHLDRAEQLFEKALYLDPVHYESLVGMSLLSKSRGNEARHQIFRRRAERSARRSSDE
jgi:chemotaxis protein methyltransferase WspC